MSPEWLYWLPSCEKWTKQFAALSQLDAIAAWDNIVQLARTRLQFNQTERLAKAITRLCGTQPPSVLPTQPIRLAVLGSATVDHLLPSIKVGAARRNLWVDLYACSYGQYRQELENPGSALYAFRPTTTLFAFDAPHIIGRAGAINSAAEADEFIEAALQQIRSLWSTAQQRLGAHVIQQTLLPVAPRLVGLNEHRLAWAPAHLIARLNWSLRDAADRAGVDLLAIDQAVEFGGVDHWFDPALWSHAKQEVHPAAAPAYGDLTGRLLAARQGRTAKCLILDLDNTIWGGTIGDDGLSGIVLGKGSATGEAFISFQAYARNLSRRGVILAVCSKNDEVNARLPFTSHPEMVLKADDIACFIANWNDKAANIRTIAERLNIGLDSLVFVDDNPFERNIIRRELPMVWVPELPSDPARFAASIADSGYFDISQLTNEDFARTSLYQADARRASLKGATDLAGYLRSLNMQLHYGRFDAVNQPRIAQLINKTNQFNLTTKRYSEEDIRRFGNDPMAITLHLRLVDQFGDNGIIGIVIARCSDDPAILEIDTWLMSCRVLGRQVEQATMNILADKARQRGARTILGTFVPTAKNAMVANHYPSLGFFPAGVNEHGAVISRLDLDHFAPLVSAISLVKEVS